MSSNQIRGPQFIQFFQPVIDALIELGGSGRPSEVKEVIAEKLNIPEDEQGEQISSGASRFSKNVDWARFYLAKAGYIDASTRGVWSLTETGRAVKLSQTDTFKLFQNIHQIFSVEKRKQKEKNQKSEVAEMSDEIPDEEEDHRIILIKKLINLPPNGFERLCQRLLRESGFESVTVTGRSGDGGLDGIGVLQVNAFVSFKVCFNANAILVA